MRPDDLFEEDWITGKRQLNAELLEQAQRGPVEGLDDLELAVPLARLVHDDLESFGTGGGEDLDSDQMRLALRTLTRVVDRLGLAGFDLPFRDYKAFRSHWLRERASGSWQARRDILEELFGSLHDQLADLENQALASTLATPISPHPRTGWPRVDSELSELRRHFLNARTPQDYRGLGNDCVHVLEALSATVYDADTNLREGETEPPVANTKQRLERYVEDELPGADNMALRKLTRASIEMAQQVKHSGTPTRKEAGIAADAIIQLANMLRRLAEDT